MTKSFHLEPMRWTPGTIVTLIVLAILFVIVAIGVNRGLKERAHIDKSVTCTENAYQHNQDPNLVCAP